MKFSFFKENIHGLETFHRTYLLILTYIINVHNFSCPQILILSKEVCIIYKVLYLLPYAIL